MPFVWTHSHQREQWGNRCTTEWGNWINYWRINLNKLVCWNAKVGAKITAKSIAQIDWRFKRGKSCVWANEILKKFYLPMLKCLQMKRAWRSYQALNNGDVNDNSLTALTREQLECHQRDQTCYCFNFCCQVNFLVRTTKVKANKTEKCCGGEQKR